MLVIFFSLVALLDIQFQAIAADSSIDSRQGSERKGKQFFPIPVLLHGPQQGELPSLPVIPALLYSKNSPAHFPYTPQAFWNSLNLYSHSLGLQSPIQKPQFQHPTIINKETVNFVAINENKDEEEFIRVPLRDAVESIPIEAEQYNTIQYSGISETEESEFSRSAVEAFPDFISTPFSIRQTLQSEDLIQDVGDEFMVGYRQDVESPPQRDPFLSPESRTSHQHVNSRQWGHLAEDFVGDFALGIRNYLTDEVLQIEKGGDDVDVALYSGSGNAVTKDYKIICYFGGWSVYRPAPFDFQVTDIDPFSCTHVIYSFAGLHKENFTIISLDPELDIVRGAYKAAVNLKEKNPDLKVLIAIGGWNEGGRTYSKMASSSSTRASFVQSVISFLEEHKFDGLDLDWEYPGASDRGGRWSDKANFAKLVQELSEEFKLHNWILSAAVSPARFRVNEGYEVAELAKYLDFVNVMTYDLRGPWDGKADHHSPLNTRPTDSWAFKTLNTQDGMELWKAKGTPSHKLIVGIPFYGRSFTLANAGDTSPGSRARGPGKEGSFTKEAGFLGYYEVCQEIQNGGWTERKDGAEGPFIVKGDQWVGYDDPSYITKKMEFIKRNQYGGAMIWAIDVDDYRGICGSKWPLLSAMRNALSTSTISYVEEKPTTVDASPSATTTKPATVSEVPPPSQTPPAATESAKVSEPSSTTVRTSDFPPPKSNLYCPDPKDCAVFYICSKAGFGHRFICPSGTLFNIKTKTCDWPRNVDCNATSLQARFDSNPCSFNGTVRLVQDCSKFSMCQNKQLSVFSCPERLFYSSEKEEYVVVCYFSNWAYLRPPAGTFVPEHVDPDLCSHLIYAFAILDTKELLIRSSDPWTDFDNNFYQRTLMLKKKNPHLKVLLSLGGWIDSQGDKYSRLISNPNAIKRFVTHATALLKAYEFDGLDLHWQYPVCWQLDCQKGYHSDKQGFATLVTKLREAFDKEFPRLILTAAVAAMPKVIENAYDVPTLSRNLDLINVMTFDYHSAWENKTGHVSPLYFRDGDDYQSQNSDFTIKQWIRKGADPRKLVMGIPFHAQTFTLANNFQNGVGVPVTASGEAGTITQQSGMLAYYEACYLVRSSGWVKATDPKGAIGPFATKGKQWFSYDDPAMMVTKGDYIKQMDLAGAMVWTIDFDDFQNRCCRERMPLLRALNRALRNLGIPPPILGGDCLKPSSPVTPLPPIRTTGYHPGVVTRPTTPGIMWFNITSTSKTSTSLSAFTTSRVTTMPTTVKTTTKTTTLSTSPSTPWWEPTTSDSTTPTPWWRPSTTISTTTPWWQVTHHTETRPPWLTTQRITSSPGTVWRPSYTTTPWTSTTPRITRTTTTPFWAPSTTSTTTKPVISPTPAEEEEEEDEKDPGDICLRGEFYQLKGYCNKFLRCRNNQLVAAQCAPELYWNQQKKRCDFLQNTRCHSTPVDGHFVFPHSTAPSTWSWVTSTTTTKSPIASSSAPCRHGDTKPIFGDCTSFQKCSSGNWGVFSCPHKLHWNNKARYCDWPRNSDCTLAIRVPSESTGSGTDLTAGEAQLAPCEQGTYQPHPTDCTLYLYCVHGEYTTMECQPPLHWNTAENVCDWPASAKCKSESSGTVDSKPVQSSTKLPYATVTEGVPTMKPQTITLPAVPSGGKLSGDFMIVCYFTNWAWYRPGIGKYRPEDIDESLCTHIVYGFAVLDYSNLVIKPHDTWADIDNKFYEKVTTLKSKGIKVTVAIGGWNDSAGDKYSRLVNSPNARRKFITHVIQFIQKYNFDGLDLDWEYPVCWQVDCKKGPKSDKDGFSSLVKELSAEFKPLGLLLSSAVSPSKKVIDEGYDVPVLNQYMDWIAVMTYDFHGHWDRKTGHVAPMYYHPDDDYDYFNMDFAIRYWLQKGASKDKIVLGMPLYGQAFTLQDSKVNGLNAPAPSGGNAGQFTRAKGFLAYYEICHHLQSGWTQVKDTEGRMGPYAYSGNQWVSFDDVDTVKTKSNYIREMGLAGGMVWALDLDDFNNRCGQGRHPLLNAIKSVLSGPRSQTTKVSSVEKPMTPVIETPKKPAASEFETPKLPTINEVEVPSSGTASVNRVADGSFKVVCYFTNWSWYRQGEGKYTPDDIDSSLCTHIVYGFAVLHHSSLTIKAHDGWADYDNKFYQRVTDHKAKGVKVLIAIGGWNDSAGDKYSRLVNDPVARKRFTKHVIDFIRTHNFDGLDLDWEYPVCWQVNCNRGPDSDKEAFSAWVKELYEAFKPHDLLLSAAVSPNDKVIDKGYEIPILNKYFDWIAVMTYDYHGQWDKKTGHVAPMYHHPESDSPTFNSNFTIHYWLEKGADRKKIVMGLPMYGQSFTLASSKNNGLNQKTYGGATAGPYTRARGFLAYYEICYFIKHNSWTVVRDPHGAIGPYAYKGTQWVGFDDIPRIQYKSNWIKDMGLGGAMIWALDLDDFRNRCDCEPHPLLRTINRVLRPGSVPPDPRCPILEVSARLPLPEDTGVITKPEPSAQPDIFIAAVPKDVDNIPPAATGETCTDGNYEPHPDDCTKFYECNHNQKKERRCFPGLNWNPTKNTCDWPNNAGCQDTGTEKPALPPSLPTVVTGIENVHTTVATTAARPLTTKPATVATKPPVIERPPSISLPDTGYKVVCYFTNWAWYRQGIGKYRPENIDSDLCTHIVYGFAVLDHSRLLIKPHDTWADYDNKFYQKVTDLKSKGIKVLIAIGGWNDSLGDKYSRLVNSPEARRRFIEHVIQFIQKHNFDGLDLDWEYPVCWQVDCKKGPASDKDGFSAWVMELHEAFKPHGLLLSAAVSPSYKVIDVGYDVPLLSQYFDWIAVMTYDYHGHWDKKTGHVAPMFYHEEDEIPQFNSGADPRKLIMGMPLYGQSFSLVGTTENGLNSKASKGLAGTYTRAAGFLAYYEICHNIIDRGWTIVRDPEGRMGPYAYSGNQWVSFDDAAMIKYKSNYVKSMGLGGAMIWALDLDDFRDRCGCEPHPLLRTINRVLRGYPGSTLCDL